MTRETDVQPVLADERIRLDVLNEYEIHPVAALWPMMSEAELQDMARDIAEHGLQEPIWMYGNQILDGRNRLVACRMAGVKPKFQPWGTVTPTDSPEAFITSKNLHRRHLSASTRAAVAVDIEEHLREERARAAEERAKIAATFSVPTEPAGATQSKSGPAPAPAFGVGGGEAAEAPRATQSKSGPAPAPAFGVGEAAEVPTSSQTRRGSAAAPAFGVGDPAVPQHPAPQGRIRDQAAKIAGVSSGYVSEARQLKQASPEAFKRVQAGEKTIQQAQDELYAQAAAEGRLGELRLSEATKRATAERLERRKAKDAAPRIRIPKFSQVESSRVEVSITAVFGSPAKAEEWLNQMQDAPSVLRLKYDVVGQD